MSNTYKKTAVYTVTCISLLLIHLLLQNTPWQGNTQIHTIMEVIASLLAFFVGILALIRYYTRKTHTIFLIGVGFFGTALLDSYHALISSTFIGAYFPSPPATLIPWSWTASRVYLAVFLFLGCLTWRKERTTTRIARSTENIIFLTASLLTLLFFLFLAFIPLPQAHYSELPFHRPEEFIAAFFLLITLAGYLGKGRWRTESFDNWIILSLIAGAIGQIMFMSFSRTLFDTMFHIGHLLKLASYIFVLVGLLDSVYRLFKQTEADSAELLAVNATLDREIAERKQVEQTLLQNNRELALLNQAGQYFNSSLDLALVLDAILEEVRHLLDVIACSIWLVNTQTGDLVCEQVVGTHSERVRGWHLSPGQGVVGRVALTGESHIVADTRSEVSHEKAVDQRTGFESRSILSMPLKVQEETIGVLQVIDTESGRFTTAHLKMLEPLVAWAAIAIQNARYYVQAQQEIKERVQVEIVLAQRVAQLALLNEIGKEIAAMLDAPRVMERVVHLVHKRFDYHHVALFVVGEEKKTLLMKSTAGHYALLYPTDHQLQWGEGIVGWVAQNKKTLLVNDTHNDTRYINYFPDVITTKSELSVPVLVGTELVGVLDIQSPQPTAFDSNDVLVMETLADQIAVSLVNARLYSALATERTLLSQRVAESTMELREANEELAQAIRTKGLFLASMSHELRTPLNGILGYAHILQKNADLLPQQAKGLNIIQESGKHLLALINDILDMSRLEAHRLELHPTEIDLITFLKGTFDVFRMPTQQKNISYECKFSDELPNIVLVDQTRLRQILHNLLANAIKFTDHGRVLFEVSKLEGTNCSATIRFEVSDTGVGIPQTDLVKIFIPFEQVGRTIHQVDGAGLGLAISHGLVNLMGGELHVSSHLNKGSTFWFDVTLPVLSNHQVIPVPIYPDIIGYKGQTLTVLIADDHTDNRSLLIDLLQPLGFQVVSMTNGLQAVEQAKMIRPDIILMDLRMPVMDGYEAIAAIRDVPELSEMPIIAVSAGVFEIDREKSLAVGGNAFLPKPVNWHQLSQLLQEHLSLEWIYADKTNQGQQATILPDKDSALSTPPLEEMKKLHELAVLGNMRLIRQHAAHLTDLDEKYQPFAAALQQMAENFQEKAILSLVEQCLETSEEL